MSDRVGVVVAAVGILFSIFACMLRVSTGELFSGWMLFNVILLALNTRNFLYHYRRLGK